MTDKTKIDLANAILQFVEEAVKDARSEEEYMLLRYGESCNRLEAGRVLGKTAATISAMIRDGRLETVPGSTKVDVRSIAQYKARAKQADFEARMRKQGRRPGMYIIPSSIAGR